MGDNGAYFLPPPVVFLHRNAHQAEARKISMASLKISVSVRPWQAMRPPLDRCRRICPLCLPFEHESDAFSPAVPPPLPLAPITERSSATTIPFVSRAAFRIASSSNGLMGLHPALLRKPSPQSVLPPPSAPGKHITARHNGDVRALPQLHSLSYPESSSPGLTSSMS